MPRGAANHALQLNGSDARIQHYGAAALSGDAPFTVAAWVKVPVSHAADAILIEQADLSENGGAGRFRIVVKADGRIDFSVYGKDADEANEGYQFGLTSVDTIHDDIWHHVACVRDGTTGRIFIDGVESVSGSGAIRELNASFYVTLGGDSAGANGFFQATLDDVRIYAEALGSDQILRVANTPKVAISVPADEEAVIPSGVGLMLEAAASSPMGPEPALSWSMVSGPGSVTFAMSSAARFSIPGIYRLRARASNGLNSASDELTVIAGNSATSTFEGFAYGAGTTGGFQLSSPGNYRLQGASTGIDTSGASDGFYLLGQAFGGDFDLRTRVAWVMDYSGQEIGSAGLVVRQGTAGATDEASGFIGFDAWSRSGRWVRRATSGGNSVQSNYGMMRLPQWCRLTRSGETVEFWHSFDGYSWLSRGTMTFTGEVRAGLCWSSKNPYSQGIASFDRVLGFSTSNIGPVVQAGGALTAEVGASVDLAGVVTDDGFPGAPVTACWSVIAGPGGVSIANPELAATTATFSQPGVHTLRLVANDGSLKTFDEVTVTVHFANETPVFLTNPILAPAAVARVPYSGTTLAGSATDANLPQGDILGFEKTGGPEWLLVAGDGTLSGTPEAADLGVNTFDVRVTDAAGASAISTLEIPVGPTILYLDANGSDPGSGAPTTAEWGAPALWSAGEEGITATHPWIPGAFAVLSAGDDAGASAITVSGTLSLGGLTVEEGSPHLTSGALGLAETDAVFQITGTAVIDSEITGTNLLKTGPGTLALGHANNTLLGSLTVAGGILDLVGSLAASGGVIVETNGTLRGGGLIGGNVAVSGTLAPGNSVGTLTTGPLVLADGARFEWQVETWNGEAGSGHDLMLADSLDLSSATSVALNVGDGVPGDFTDQAADFTLVRTTSGITGFDAGKFIIDSSALPGATGHWRVKVIENDLILSYTPLTPYAAWQIAKFVPNADDPLVVGELMDPDRDGLPNLIEYALDLDPNESGVSGTVQDLVEIEGATFLRLSIPRNPDAADVTYTVQTTSDLSNPDGWSEAHTHIEVDTPSLLVVRDTLGGPHRFIRLRVTR